MARTAEIEAFSTFDMDRAASVEAWRFFMKEVYFRLDIEPLQADALSGRLAKRGIAALGSSFLSADDQRVIRSAELTQIDVAECFCLVFVTRGHFTVRQRRREAHASPGDVYLVNAQEAYEVDLTQAPEMLCLTIPADLLRSRVKNVDDFCARDQFADRTMSFALRSLVSGALAEEPIADAMRLQDLCLSMTDMTLVPGGTAGEGTLLYSERNFAYVVARAKHAMRKHYGDPALSVAQVAIACGVSTRQLQNAFQKAGTSFVIELTKIRMNAAAVMLRSSGDTAPRIGDIAFRCGFTSQAYFATCFRKFFGHSPRDEVSTASSSAQL